MNDDKVRGFCFPVIDVGVVTDAWKAAKYTVAISKRVQRVNETPQRRCGFLFFFIL